MFVSSAARGQCAAWKLTYLLSLLYSGCADTTESVTPRRNDVETQSAQAILRPNAQQLLEASAANLDATIADHPNPDAVTWVIIDGGTVDKLDLLAKCSQLRKLTFVDTEIKSLAPLAQLKRLEDVSFLTCTMRDWGSLVNLRSARRIVLQNCNIVNLRPLSSLKSIERLAIVGTEVSDLRPLGSLPSLKRLSIRPREFSDEQLELIRKLNPNVNVVVPDEA